MVVYLDVLFVVNSIMNFATLAAAGRLGGVRIRRVRLLCAAAAGGAYAVLTAVYPWTAALLLRLLAGIGVCSLAFAGENRMARLYGLYLLVSAAFAGLAAALGMATGRRLSYGAGYYFAVPMRVLLLSAAVGYALSGVLLRGDAQHGPLRREVEQLSVCFMGKESAVCVLLDTGNTLTEPVCGRPAVIVDKVAAKRLLGIYADILHNLNRENAAAQLVLLPEQVSCRFGLLPYSAVGTAAGLLLFFRPDYVKRADGKILDCVIAISPEKTWQGAYEGLIGV
ncbi:MAG: sigma-E processing peptidase SpoIIGA [Agathobaculum sp.]|jgi:stage II sporulation protein GA (sporulation sigma-E factor processing peptidase)|uniref:sigma-E processing peptidase SpoIIGA n=1 Tax=Agathobaculum sp. TaxID=2048138 RepID=UPI003D917593